MSGHADRSIAPAGAMSAPMDGRICELCEAARITPWFYEDDECWVADCEACDVPMVVWKVHSPVPPDDTRARMHARLLGVVGELFSDECVIDDHLRSIPDHYHAHARPRRFPGRGPLTRRMPSTG